VLSARGKIVNKYVEQKNKDTDRDWIEKRSNGQFVGEG
jgi:hypothetical protein